MNPFMTGLGNVLVGITQDPSYTEATNEAIAVLRSPDYFSWYLVPIFTIMLYIYFVEIERKNWNVLLAGLAFYGLEWFLEILNAIFLYVFGHSAVWTAPADSAYVITVGLNIEITFWFAFAGILFAKVLPKDKSMKILGINNRIFLAFLNAILCVIVEIVLNRWDALIWEYWWWNWKFPFIIILIGYSLYMFFTFWVHDMESMKKKIAVVGGMWGIVAVFLIVFMGILHWI
ncbi:MAG: hypothetical protein JW885_13595 [Deltaproteobacteria bacterium]|nr:hypothetical protein [Candidatus Zymogenaceae bacterium]